MKSIKDEPTLIIYSIVAGLNAVQLAAVSMPVWLHVVILAAIAAGGAFVNRQLVTPVAKRPAAKVTAVRSKVL